MQRDKAENQYWVPAIFRSSDGTALKTGTILSQKSLHEHSSSSRSPEAGFLSSQIFTDCC